MAKKIYIVEVETEMPVFAESKEEAENLARQHVREEDPWMFTYWPREVKDANSLTVDILDSLPWGGSDDRTVMQHLEEYLGKR